MCQSNNGSNVLTEDLDVSVCLSIHSPLVVVLDFLFIYFFSSGNHPKWERNVPKEHWQSAHGSGVARAGILGMPIVKTCLKQVLVITASYPLLKRLMSWPATLG